MRYITLPILFFTVLFDIATIGGVGSICNFMNYLYDDHIQQALKGQNEEHKDFARGLVGYLIRLLVTGTTMHCFDVVKM